MHGWLAQGGVGWLSGRQVVHSSGCGVRYDECGIAETILPSMAVSMQVLPHSPVAGRWRCEGGQSEEVQEREEGNAQDGGSRMQAPPPTKPMVLAFIGQSVS